MQVRQLVAAAWLFACACGAAGQPAPDFSSTAGLERTCRGLEAADPAKLKSEVERVAYAICAAVAVLRESARWQRDLEGGARVDEKQTLARIRDTLEAQLVRIAKARQALERVKSAGPYLRIEPGNWEIDLNGDGRLDAVEKYFFWVPKRGLNAFPAEKSHAAHYEAHFAKPVIRVDRSDLYWTIAYCHYLEAALNLVLAYDFTVGPDGFRVELRDAKRIATRAYRSLLGGVAYSARLRAALGEETDDAEEWIANPAQKNTSFPLLMDVQTFVTWGLLLEHMDKLFRGETLLGGATAARNFAVRDLTMGVCDKGEGINVRELFLDPIRQPADGKQWRLRCAKPSARVPMTELPALIDESIRRNAGRGAGELSGEWMILRHLYWVN